MNRVSVRTDRNDVRQLAAKGQVARNVLVDGCVMDEVGAAVFGVEDHHLTPEILSDEVEWRGEVRITADEYEGFQKESPSFFKRGPRSALAEPFGWMQVLSAKFLSDCNRVSNAMGKIQPRASRGASRAV